MVNPSDLEVFPEMGEKEKKANILMKLNVV